MDKSMNVSKSPNTIRVPSQLFSVENGHPVLPIEVGPQLHFRYDSKSRTLAIDIPHWAIEGMEKVGILRLHFSPDAAHYLAHAIHAIEEESRGPIGEETNLRVH
jgi:hypothetical protein